MNEITLENYRCFREKQTVRLAPLTLLVGENSTGKTSFLAMVRALWDVSFGNRVPDFKEEPYDLGSFDEIAHYRGGRGGRAGEFDAAVSFDVSTSTRRRGILGADSLRFGAKFQRVGAGTVPLPILRRIEANGVWIESDGRNGREELLFGTPNGAWKWRFLSTLGGSFDELFMPLPFLVQPALYRRSAASGDEEEVEPIRVQGAARPSETDWRRFEELRRLFHRVLAKYQRPYAGAPVRSKPRRSYDPASASRDPEGDYIPMFLSDIYRNDPKTWENLRRALEDFGRRAGLFDEIAVKRFGTKGTEPFQIQVRKFGTRAKGPLRNLIDVGYGVSQVLPLVTELVRDDAPSTFLLQQPEVHLHPSAQAALGSLFCALAGKRRQLIVETHSDHLADRIRMEVREGTYGLRPEDVSVLFFERRNLSVKIHELGFDHIGNVTGAPGHYRQFFLDEVNRSLGVA